MDEKEIFYGAEDLYCPHCGEKQYCKQYCHEPEEFSGYCYNTICEHCGCKIEYSVDVTRAYYPLFPDDEDEKKEGENQ